MSKGVSRVATLWLCAVGWACAIKAVEGLVGVSGQGNPGQTTEFVLGSVLWQQLYDHNTGVRCDTLADPLFPSGH